MKNVISTDHSNRSSWRAKSAVNPATGGGDGITF